MLNQSTHFTFDRDKVEISPDLKDVIKFLLEIEKEINDLLTFDKKLESIKKQHLETMELVEVLAGKLKEHSIDFKFTFSEHPESIVEKLKISRPIRSEMIIIFAYLEVIFCLNIAYKNKTSDKTEIIRIAMNQHVIKSFITEFCLSNENEWCKNNQERWKHITPVDLRDLRNSLTHFFSVSETLAISYPLFGEAARKLEKVTNFKAKFISPEDLLGIVEGAIKLMIIKWSDDCNYDLTTKSDEFSEKIFAVKSIVEKYAAELVERRQINI